MNGNPFDTPEDTSKASMQPLDTRRQNRYTSILASFQEIDPDLSRSFKFEEILQFLSHKCEFNGKAPFNRELCQEIFARMNNSLTSIVTAEEFVHYYVLIETKIGENVALGKEEIKTLQGSLSQAEKKLIQARASEEMNEHGISRESVFTISVHEADGVEQGPWRVRLQAGEQETQTDVAREQYNTLYWTDKFTFRIFTGEEVLVVDIVDCDVTKTQDRPNDEVISIIKRTLGSVQIPISTLRDQQKKTEYFTLEDHRGRIFLSLQWIWSMGKYLEDVIRQYQERLREARLDLQNLQGQADRLQEPFPMIVEQQTQLSIPGLASFDKMMDKLDPYISRVDTMSERLIGRSVQWERACLASTLAFLLISLLAMLIRPDFPNLMIALIGWMYYANKSHSAMTFKLLAGVVMVSQVFDFIWLVCNFGYWIAGTQFADGAENGIRRFGLAMAVLNFAAKILVGIVYWRHSIELRQ